MRAVLFDFDGTLADSAPDLGAALNRMRAVRQMDPVPVEVLRGYASSGARGLPQASTRVRVALLEPRPATGDGIEAAVDRLERVFTLIGSPAYRLEREAFRGSQVQFLAAAYSPCRIMALRRTRTPRPLDIPVRFRAWALLP